MMKKKIIALMLLAALVLTLAACGGSDVPKGTVSEASAEEAAETTEALTEETTVEAEETTEAETSIFELGTTNGLVYENPSIGIGCNLPEGWTAYDDDQIAELNGILLDSVDSDIKEQLEKATYIYDMMASDADNLDNVNVIVQNLSLLQSMAITSASDLEDALEATEESLVSTIEGMGATDVSFRIDRARTFPAKLYACAEVTGQINDMQLTERLVMFKVGNHLVNVTAATFGVDLTNDILDTFYEVK